MAAASTNAPATRTTQTARSPSPLLHISQHVFRRRPSAYTGNAAYAFAKRGQVLLARAWADREAARVRAGELAAPWLPSERPASQASAAASPAAAAAAAAARLPAAVTFVSCHPGWVATPGVAAAYGRAGEVLLAPLRTLRQGAEGVAWLAGVAQARELQAGAFYLDRAPQLLHLPRSEAHTGNTGTEVAELMGALAAMTRKAPECPK